MEIRRTTMNMKEAITSFLKERPGEKFTAQQLAEWYCHTYPEECQRRVLIREFSEMIEHHDAYPEEPDRKRFIRETAAIMADRLLAEQSVNTCPLETNERRKI